MPTPPGGSTARHDRADFAQEFLRRNRRYRAAWLLDRGDAGHDAAAIWGLVRLFDPARPVRSVPAFWRADAASQIVIFDTAPPDLPGAIAASALPSGVELILAGVRHLVADQDGLRHRLQVRAADPEARLSMHLPPLGDTLRAAACDAALRMLAGRATAEPAALLRPSSLQRQRLALLLRILDADAAGGSNREIGIAIVYPWLAGTAATAWKASGERRRVQRLLAEARHLADGGYRDLLRT